jgi:hypothetical protein
MQKRAQRSQRVTGIIQANICNTFQLCARFFAFEAVQSSGALFHLYLLLTRVTYPYPEFHTQLLFKVQTFQRTIFLAVTSRREDSITETI